MNFKKMKIFFTLFVILLLNSCNSSKKEELMKGFLTIDFQEGDLPTLHPHDMMVHLRGISIGKTLFEQLTRLDEEGKAVLAGAKSIDVSLDTLSYTFKLRENYWSDGSKVNAYQYEKAFKEALSPTSACPRPDLLYMIKNSIEVKRGKIPLNQLGVKALDEETLVIELGRPSPHFLELLAQPMCAPLQRPEDRNIQAFNGPFYVSKWERNNLIRLVPNPYFWNHKNVKLKQIDILIVQNPETAYTLYEQKKLDWIGVPLCPLSVEQIEHLKKKNELISRSIERVFWVFLNTQHKILSNPYIRKALSLAIDRKTITENVLIGSNPLEKPFPYSLLPKDASLKLEMNLKEANKQLGIGLKEMGIEKKDLQPLVIAYSQQANRKQMAEYLQEAWSSNLGIEVKLEPQEWNVLRSNLGKGQYEISGSFVASFYHDPLEIMERMTTLNSSNFSRWIFPIYQKKVNKALYEIDIDHRQNLISEAEDILMEEMPFIPISSDRFLFAHHPKLKGYTFDSVGAIDFSYASMK